MNDIGFGLLLKLDKDNNGEVIFKKYGGHGVRHRQKSGTANTEYIVYKNYNNL